MDKIAYRMLIIHGRAISTVLDLSLIHICQKLDLGPLRHSHDLVYHLINGLFVDLPAALWTVGDTNAGIELSLIHILTACIQEA